MNLTKFFFVFSPLASLFVGLTAAPASADTWIAKCNNLQFNFQRDNDRFLVYFQTDNGTYQVAQGSITFDNGTAVRGPVKGNDSYIGAGGGNNANSPITQIGLNSSRNMVYIFYQHPRNNTQETGTFCNTQIQRQNSDRSDENNTDFTGVWDTNFGELRLYQVQNYVIGDYANQGIILGKTKDSCVAGIFTNGDRNGIFRFTMSNAGKFRGKWAWQGNNLDRNWQGNRTANTVEQLQNFTRDGSTTSIIDNDRTVFDGTYSSPYGKVEIMARDLFLIGDYADKGILAGMWDGNSFVGRFTNGDRTGWFNWEFLSADGSFREGSWDWIGDNSSSNWPLQESSSNTPQIDNMLDGVSCQ